MIVKKSKILKLSIIFPNTNFLDIRGRYLETFNEKLYKKKFNINFVEDDVTISKKNVFRGIHGDEATWKLISCLHGKCLSIIVNCDRTSADYGKHEKFILSANKYFQILIPPKYGNSFLTLSSFSVYHYKQSSYYSGSKKQFTYNYKDPFFKINISNYVTNPIISKRDKIADFLNCTKKK